MKKITIILLLLITFCSGNDIDESKLASDSEMVWCLSQENYVRAGATLVATGWNGVEFIESGESYEGDEATKAKEIYRTLENSIKFYEFNNTTSGLGDFKSYFGWKISKSYISKTNYLDALKSSKIEGENNYKSYEENIFLHWREIKTSFESNDSNLTIKENYINSYSICKLWYESNN